MPTTAVDARRDRPPPTSTRRRAGAGRVLRPRRRGLARRRADRRRGRRHRARCATPGCGSAFVSNNSSQPVGDVVGEARALRRAGRARRRGHQRASPRPRCSRHDAARRAPACSCAAGPGVVEALDRRRARRGPRGAGRRGGRRASTATSTSTALDRASDAVRDGARFVATNLDATYPMPGGACCPGAGSIVAAVADRVRARTPEVAGKPEAPTVALVRAALRAPGRDGRRPAVDRRRAGRPRSAGRSRSCSRGSPRRSRRRAARRSPTRRRRSSPPTSARSRPSARSRTFDVSASPPYPAAGDRAPTTRRRAGAPGPRREPSPGASRRSRAGRVLVGGSRADAPGPPGRRRRADRS